MQRNDKIMDAKITKKELSDHKALKDSKALADSLAKEGKKRWKALDSHVTNKTLTKVRIDKSGK